MRLNLGKLIRVFFMKFYLARWIVYVVNLITSTIGVATLGFYAPTWDVKIENWFLDIQDWFLVKCSISLNRV